MTSNIGSTYLLDGIDAAGGISDEAQQMTMNDLKAHFRPEFLNRLDEIIMYERMTSDSGDLSGQEVCRRSASRLLRM